MTNDEKMRELQKQFAELCGLPLRHEASPAGELHDASGRVVWHWFRCPRHGTWLQPVLVPAPHWACQAEGCNVIRAAKLRTFTEREIFRLMRHIETHG